MDKPNTLMGPYRATKLWNDVIRTFRTGMPTAKHRRYMRTHDNCFVASDAIDWLHTHLQQNPNFGCEVTRNQTVQLLQKFLKAKVFEDVRGSKHSKDQFDDNGRLYRFTHSSPLKTIPKRTPLSSRTAQINQRGTAHQAPKMDIEKMKSVNCVPEQGLPECHLVAKALNAEEVEGVWKAHTLNNLQKVLNLSNLDEILEADYVNSRNIIHNMTQVNKNGVVSNIPSESQLPHWVMSAMRVLAHWPKKVEDGLPSYPGFECDVFKVVKDYFLGLDEPLLTYPMYEVFINVLVLAENADRSDIVSPSTSGLSSRSADSGITSFQSVENLMLNMTMNAPTHPPAQRKNYNENNTREPKSVSDWDLSRIEYIDSEQKNRNRYGSRTSITSFKYETAFVGSNNETVTRIIAEKVPASSREYNYESRNDFYAINNIQNTHKFTSMMNLNNENQSESEETNLAYTHKYYSTTNVNDAEPIPENNLRKTWLLDSASTVASEYCDNRGLYGYTVALSRAPKYSPSNRHYESEAVMNSASRNEDRSTSGLFYRSESHGVLPLRPDPPPYKPPPRYEMLHLQRRASQGGSNGQDVSSDSSRSSYHTTRSHLSSSANEPTFYSAHSQWEAGYQALYGDNSATGNSTTGNSIGNSRSYRGSSTTMASNTRSLRRLASSSSLFETGCKKRVQEALQYCCLMIPPANRRKLHLLLRLMSKIANNKELHLDDTIDAKELVLHTFARCILRSQEEADLDEILANRLVSYMIDHYDEILSVPEELKKTVEGRLAYMRRAQIKYTHGETIPITYCAQVSVKEYENARFRASLDAMDELLETIIRDKRMTVKEKKKRLKQFQKAYPEIYSKRFPTSESEAELFPLKPKIKQPLLAKSLQRIKSLRF